MAWLQVHQSLPAHHKTLRCADLLSIPEAHVVGHLVILWLWALDNTMDGRLPGVSPSMIERIVRWDGEPSAFVDALAEVGFLDYANDEYVIHDWEDYAGKLLDRRAANRERQRRYRERKRNEANKTDDAHPRVTSPSRHGARGEKSKEEEKKISVPSKNEYSEDFEAFWTHYPRKIEKRRAYRAWQARLKAGKEPEDLQRAAQNYAAECAREQTARRYIKHPSTFLSADEPFTEYLSDGGQTEPLQLVDPSSGLAAALRSAQAIIKQREKEALHEHDDTA